ncbi:sensor histidine kinase [Nocardioides nanhaiensis]|uniref:histidine kinase n=1 Tax=Nocardioides nanhaiensis TaxID=1476871 RepID=A0ABP8VSP6_9ACTN
MSITSVPLTAPRVVLVDDTADLRELMRMALTRGGYDVVGEAGDGRQGIEVCAAQQPDLVLLDLAMPVMDGIEALPGIRRRCPTARIVVLSGFGADQMAARAVAAGADGYVQKGAPIRSMLAYLQQVRHDGGATTTTTSTATAGTTGRSLPPLSLVSDPPGPPPDSPRPPPDTLPGEALALAPLGVLALTPPSPAAAGDEAVRVLAFNPEARALLGADLCEGATLEQVAPRLAEALARHRLHPDAEYELETATGVRVRVRQRAADGSLLLYLDRAPEDAQLLRRAIATAAHEVRGPVTVLGGVAEMIAEESDVDGADLARMMRAVTRQVRILDTITADLLTAAQVHRGSLRLQLRPVDPGEVATLALERSGVRGEAATVRVLDPRTVLADPLRLEQMVANLVHNAVKYGAPPIEVQVRGSHRSGHLEIAVLDRGGGVPEAFHSRLFSEFARADGVTAAGTGLGLYVVRTLAEAQDGAVAYAPREGGGAEFTITLPAA